jgi:tripartite-type tricarboxylate transporter receptor subunit TctC
MPAMGRNAMPDVRMIAVVAAFVALAAAPAFAQEDWPARPLTMVIPFDAGGPTDVIGRVLAPAMSESLGRQVIVENVAGAGGMTGAARVAHANPDGYQFLLGAAGPLAQNQTLYKHPLYNSAVDFSPVGLIAVSPPILVTRPDFPADDLQGFTAYAKQHSGALQFGSGGAGSGPHVTCVLLDTALGISAVHVPYRGTGAAYPDLLAGRLDYMCDFISTALPQINAHAVKPIATLTRNRAAALPDLPTASEQGLTGFDAPGWYALVLPKATPAAIVRRLNKAMSDALDAPDVRDRLTRLGNTVVPPLQRTPDYLAGFIASEIVKWAGPIEASGVSIE